MKIEAIVGERVRDMRERRGLSQPELGRRLEPLLGVAWPKQTVSSAEKGKRSFTASDLVALAHVLQVPVGYLLKAPMGVDAVELASGASIPAESLHEATLPDDVNREALHDLGQAIADIANEVEATHTRLVERLGTAAILYDEAT